MLLCAAALTAFLVIGGVEQNSGPGVEVDNSLQVLCSGRERNLKPGTQCDMCGRCGNVKVQMADSGKWSCDRCRWDRLHQLQEKLENALQQIEELKQKNKGLEEQLQGAIAGFEVGSRDTVRRQDECAKCLVLSDSIIRNVESEHVRVQCFPGIRTEQLQRVMENRDLGSPDTVVIHVGTNDLCDG
jgi:ribosomal protein L37AE/L43A